MTVASKRREQAAFSIITTNHIIAGVANEEVSTGIKAQFKRADASGARYALIFGSDEMADGVVTVKALRDASVALVRHPLDNVDQWAHSLQSAA